MKKWCVLLAVIVVFSSVIANAAGNDPGTVKAYPGTLSNEAMIMMQPQGADEWFEKWSFKMSRGLINCASCWVELPRSLYIETEENPFIGPLMGIFKGSGLTFVRAFAGVMDLATFGTTDDTYTVYDQYRVPYFVWQDYGKSER